MRPSNATKALSVLLVLTFGVSAALADDWQAIKLRGSVFVSHDRAWVRLNRGDVVSDSSAIRILSDGVVEFVRDRETIDLAPNTQIRIFDRAGQRFTTVQEFYGAVSIEANVENVRHFAVRTPFVAALVKGTMFTVTSNAQSSTVRVRRGVVGVEDLLRKLFAEVRRGQQATAGRVRRLGVTAAGTVGAADSTGQAFGAAAAATSAPAGEADAAAAANSSALGAVAGDATAAASAATSAAASAVGAATSGLGAAVGAATGGVGASVGAVGAAAGHGHGHGR